MKILFRYNRATEKLSTVKTFLKTQSLRRQPEKFTKKILTVHAFSNYTRALNVCQQNIRLKGFCGLKVYQVQKTKLQNRKKSYCSTLLIRSTVFA